MIKQPLPSKADHQEELKIDNASIAISEIVLTPTVTEANQQSHFSASASASASVEDIQRIELSPEISKQELSEREL